MLAVPSLIHIEEIIVRNETQALIPTGRSVA